MSIPTVISLPVPRKRCRLGGFTLIELLTVISIILLVARFMIPAFIGLNGAGDFTSALDTVSGTLEQARAFAMAKNTFVFVGITEVDSSVSGSSPQTGGTGQIVMSVVSSKDGTCMTSGSGWSPDSAHLWQVSKAIRIQNAHLQPVPVTSGNLARPVSDALIESGSATPFPFAYPLSGTAGYNFTNVIQFSPQGAATLVQSVNPHYIELGIYQTHGTAVSSVQQAKYAAIQIDGVSGAVRTFRP